MRYYNFSLPAYQNKEVDDFIVDSYGTISYSCPPRFDQSSETHLYQLQSNKDYDGDVNKFLRKMSKQHRFKKFKERFNITRIVLQHFNKLI